LQILVLPFNVWSMNTVRNISEVNDLLPVASDFTDLLIRNDNADIALEFPGSVARYSGNVENVLGNLLETREGCVPGIRQQFIAFAGERAVGIAAIRFADDTQLPEGIDSSWPNYSGFVCNPYRNRGLGTLSALEGLRVVDSQFGGKAWTKVKKTNISSHKMVTRAGFVVVGEDADSNLYTYQSA
jgi:hypothetical protein